MKKAVIIFLGLILVISIFISGVNINSNKKISESVFSKIQRENSARIIVELKNSSGMKDKIAQSTGYKIYLDVNLSSLIELENNPDVKSVELVGEKHLFLIDSVPFINGTKTWNVQFNKINLTGSGQTACILDTGTNFSHPDLLGKNLTCVIDCAKGGSYLDCAENCSAGDFNGHGTHVAGIIAANGNLKGVAPDANLISVKVCVPEGGSTICYDNDIRAGLDWCIANKNNFNISVISMSLGSSTLYSDFCDGVDDSSNLTGAINDAVGQNISVIVATGNDGSTTGIASPACVENSTAVGAVSKSDNIFYNRNRITDLFAPGVLIESTWSNGKYTISSGTSMAAPHVAGSFLLINQFAKLQDNKILSSGEIQNSLNSTGKKIADAESGLTFSRIDIYSAILSLDGKAPEVSLISPSEISFTGENITFVCNATDELQLSNITIKIWNSTNYLVNETAQSSASNIFDKMNLNVLLPSGNYKWNCFASDKKSNSAFAPLNFSLTVGNTLTTLNSPSMNYFTNQNETNFNCSSQTLSNLSSSDFYLWNSIRDLIYKETKNISGTSNETIFNYTFSDGGNYFWNCLTFNNETDSSFAELNFSIAYDITSPEIILNSPADGYSGNSEAIIFSYNLTELNPANCSLIINNQTETINSVSEGINYFSKSLSPATYSWRIDCTDLANNKQNSSTRNLIINSETISAGGSSGGGGGGGGGNYIANKTIPKTNQTKIIFSQSENFSENKSEKSGSESYKKTETGITGAFLNFIEGEKFINIKFLLVLAIGIFILIVILIKYKGGEKDGRKIKRK